MSEDTVNYKLPSGKMLYGVSRSASKEEAMKSALQSGEYTLADFQPVRKPASGRDIAKAAHNAVQAEADKLNNFQKAAVGYMETLDRASGRVASLFGIDTGYEERTELSSQVKGGAALAGRVAAPLIAGIATGGGLIAQTAFGAASGALTAEDPKSGAMLGAAGGAAGNVAGRLLGRVGNGMRGKWAERVVRGTDEESGALRKLAQLGFKMTPGRASGNTVMQNVDDLMGSNPIIGSAHQSIAKENSKLLTRYASKSIGYETDDIGSQALQNMDQSLNKAFDGVAKQIDEVDMSHVVDRVSGIPSITDRALRQMDIDPTDFKNISRLSGRQYLNLRSRLLELYRKGGDDANSAWGIIDDMDDAVDGVTPEGFKESYAFARERWKNLLVLEKYKKGLSSGGHVNPVTADSAARTIYKKMYSRLGAQDENGNVVKPLLKETDDFLHALRGMATDRMAGKAADRISSQVSLYGTLAALGSFGNSVAGPLGALAAVPAAFVGSRAALAAPSALGAGVGGGLGRIAPNFLDEIER